MKDKTDGMETSTDGAVPPAIRTRLQVLRERSLKAQNNNEMWVLETFDGRPIFCSDRKAMYSEFRLPEFLEAQESDVEKRASRLASAQREVGLPLRWRQRK